MRRAVIPLALSIAIFVAALTAPSHGRAVHRQQAPARSLMSHDR